jgi:hypothetical protein
MWKGSDLYNSFVIVQQSVRMFLLPRCSAAFSASLNRFLTASPKAVRFPASGSLTKHEVAGMHG